MKQTPPIDFQKLLADIGDSRNFLDEAAATMTGETRKNYDKLLGAIDHHFEVIKTEVPKCQQMFVDKFEELKEQHEKNVVDLEAARANFEKIKKQIADGDIPQPQSAQDMPIDTERGTNLRDELLKKFAPSEEKQPKKFGVAWEDWNLNGNWNNSGSSQTNS